jgi:5,10-methylene-tetrahydrofolate dehydrogenase/methenyl tetrahydrofolate cyclohydrolase
MARGVRAILGAVALERLYRWLDADVRSGVLRSVCLAIVLLAPSLDDVPRPTLVSTGKKQLTFSTAGVRVRTVLLSGDAAACVDAVRALGRDDSVRGIVVQYPIPRGFDDVLLAVPPDKDFDGMNRVACRGPACTQGDGAPQPLHSDGCGASTGVVASDRGGPAGAARSDGRISGDDVSDATDGDSGGGDESFGATATAAALLARHHHRASGVATPVLVAGHLGVVGGDVCVLLQRWRVPWRAMTCDADIDAADIIVTAMGTGGFFTPTVLARRGAARRLIVDVGFQVVDGRAMGDVHPAVYTAEPPATQYITPVPCGCGPLEMAVLLYRFAAACGASGVARRCDRDGDGDGEDRSLDVLCNAAAE